MCMVNKKLTMSKDVSGVAGEARGVARAQARPGRALQKRPVIRDGRKSREVAVGDGITTLG
jgi:hypothetical protein